MGLVGRIGLTSLVFVVLALCRPYTPLWAGAHHSGGAVAAASEIPPCNSIIYCHGPLLHTVQMMKIFPDSKTFVDMPMRQHPDIVYEAFLQLMPDPTAEEVLVRARAGRGHRCRMLAHSEGLFDGRRLSMSTFRLPARTCRRGRRMIG